jgi:3-deoxy-D-manno-octulosonic acid (KDO) 8-phosphate synthase
MSQVKNTFAKSIQMKEEFRQTVVALTVVWTLATLISAAIIAAPFFISRQSILSRTPQCVSVVRYHKECFMCGMTRAFITISSGEIDRARSFNRGSVYLYLAFVANMLVYLLCFNYLKTIFFNFIHSKKTTK